MTRPSRRALALLGLATAGCGLGLAPLGAFASSAGDSLSGSCPALVAGPASTEAKLQVPRVVLAGLALGIVAEGAPPGVALEVAGKAYAPLPDEQGPRFEDVSAPAGDVVFLLRGADGEVLACESRLALPGWLSLLPPVVAFALALTLRQVIPALFVAIWLGAFLIVGPSWQGIWQGMLDAVAVHVVSAVTDASRITLIVFTFMLGGFVAIIARNGGAHGIVERLAAWAGSARRGQFATFGMGLAFFFDDYANTLIVGKTMRPLTDAARISREKLAFIVDSTAAPVATLALISSWIGFQLGLIEEAVARTEGLSEPAYGIFLNSLAYNFYPVLMLLFVCAVAWTGRDFGPMAQAERRARQVGLAAAGPLKGFAAHDDNLAPKPGIPTRPINAWLPLAVLVAAMLGGLYATGTAAAGPGASLRDIVGAADSHLALLWATLIGVLAAGGLSIGQRILNLAEAMDAWYVGCRSMLFAAIVMVLAWALSSVNGALHTAEYLTALLGDALDARLLPAIVFSLAACTAFATGTSWGVMGILMPIVIPLAWAATHGQGLEGAHGILYACVSAVLAGAVLGDHASPISDTTILSSVAASCDHIDHVRTQAPYAGAVGAIALATGLLPSAYGVPWWLCMALGGGCVVALVRGVGRRPA